MKLTIPRAFEIYCSVHASFKNRKNMLGMLSKKLFETEDGVSKALSKRNDYKFFMMIPNRYETVERFCNTSLAHAARSPNGFHVSDFFAKEEEVRKAELERQKFTTNQEYWLMETVNTMLEQASIAEWCESPMSIYQGLMRGFISYEAVACFENGFRIISKTETGNPIWDPIRSNLITYSYFCKMRQSTIFQIRKNFD